HRRDGSGTEHADDLRNRTGIVKLLGIILLPGNRRYFPDVIATDPPFRRPALSPLFQPNSRIAASSLGGTPARTVDAVGGESVGQWGHTRPRIAGHALLTCTPACDAPVGTSADGSSHTGY